MFYRQNVLWSVWLAGAGVLFSSALPRAIAQEDVAAERPNFVVVFTDDQGYGDLSCYGSETIETPRIDRCMISSLFNLMEGIVRSPFRIRKYSSTFEVGTAFEYIRPRRNMRTLTSLSAGRSPPARTSASLRRIGSPGRIANRRGALTVPVTRTES